MSRLDDFQMLAQTNTFQEDAHMPPEVKPDSRDPITTVEKAGSGTKKADGSCDCAGPVSVKAEEIAKECEDQKRETERAQKALLN